MVFGNNRHSASQVSVSYTLRCLQPWAVQGVIYTAACITIVLSKPETFFFLTQADSWVAAGKVDTVENTNGDEVQADISTRFVLPEAA